MLSVPSSRPLSISKPVSGLTLVEMMFTLLVLSVLISVSAPSLTDFIADRRVAASTQTLYGSMMLARSEAIKRRSSVSLCNSVDGSHCSEEADNWQTGWLIFEDEDADGDRDVGDVLIQVFEGQPELVSLSWNLTTPPRYNSQGRARQGGSFTLCDDAADGFESRQIILSLTGRVRVSESGTCN